jgi:hypothetical protein
MLHPLYQMHKDRISNDFNAKRAPYWNARADYTSARDNFIAAVSSKDQDKIKHWDHETTRLVGIATRNFNRLLGSID